MTITTSNGTTITLEVRHGDTVVVLDNPDAPDDMRNTEVGRVTDGGFQPVMFCPWGLTAETLRAIAQAIDPACASDEPSERGDFPYCDLGPATSETVGALDLDAIEGRARYALEWGDSANKEMILALVAEVRSLRAKVAEVEALAERLAASLALVLYDAHPVYGSTTLWRGGIGGQAMTAHCAIIHGGPPGMEWTESDLPSMALREFITATPGFNLDAAKADMLTDLRAALATGEGKS